MKTEVENKSAKDDRTIEDMEKQAYVAYIKKFTLQYMTGSFFQKRSVFLVNRALQA